MGAAAELFLQRKNIAVAELLHRLPDIRKRGGIHHADGADDRGLWIQAAKLFQKFPVFTGKDGSLRRALHDIGGVVGAQGDDDRAGLEPGEVPRGRVPVHGARSGRTPAGPRSRRPPSISTRRYTVQPDREKQLKSASRFSAQTAA